MHASTLPKSTKPNTDVDTGTLQPNHIQKNITNIDDEISTLTESLPNVIPPPLNYSEIETDQYEHMNYTNHYAAPTNTSYSVHPPRVSSDFSNNNNKFSFNMPPHDQPFQINVFNNMPQPYNTYQYDYMSNFTGYPIVPPPTDSLSSLTGTQLLADDDIIVVPPPPPLDLDDTPSIRSLSPTPILDYRSSPTNFMRSPSPPPLPKTPPPPLPTQPPPPLDDDVFTKEKILETSVQVTTTTSLNKNKHLRFAEDDIVTPPIGALKKLVTSLKDDVVASSGVTEDLEVSVTAITENNNKEILPVQTETEEPLQQHPTDNVLVPANTDRRNRVFVTSLTETEKVTPPPLGAVKKRVTYSLEDPLEYSDTENMDPPDYKRIVTKISETNVPLRIHNQPSIDRNTKFIRSWADTEQTTSSHELTTKNRHFTPAPFKLIRPTSEIYEKRALSPTPPTTPTTPTRLIVRPQVPPPPIPKGAVKKIPPPVPVKTSKITPARSENNLLESDYLKNKHSRVTVPNRPVSLVISDRKDMAFPSGKLGTYGTVAKVILNIEISCRCSFLRLGY